MQIESIEYISIFLLSMLKFIAGPTMGTAAGLSLIETILITIGGMMTSVVIFSVFGRRIRGWYFKKFKSKQKIFTRKNRRFVKIWKKYGEFGVSFLTPILFSPIGGTLLLSTLGASKKNIIGYMFVSSIFWSVVFSTFFHLTF